MQPMQVNLQFAPEGFGGSRFSPMRRMGAFNLGPVMLAQGNGPAPTPTPTPTPTPAPTPAPSPDVIVRPTYIVPPAAYPTYPPEQPVFVTEAMSDDTKTLLTVIAAVGIFTLGAVLF